MFDKRESEKIVLGNIIKNQNLFENKEVENLKEEHFELIEEKAIFSVFKDAYEKGISNIKSFFLPELKKKYSQSEAEKYLLTAKEYYLFSKNIDPIKDWKTIKYHIKVLENKFSRKSLIKTLKELEKKANNENIEIEKIIGDFSSKMLEISSKTKDERVYTSEELSSYKLDDMEYKQNLKEDAFIYSGFKDLDKIIVEGFAGTKLTVLGARPAMGKSAFALNLAKNFSKRKKPTLFISLEMGALQIVDRMLAEESNLTLTTIKTIYQHQQEVFGSKFSKSINKFAQLPFYLADGIGSLEEIITLIRKMQKKYQIEVVIIDYLQLMTSNKGKYINRVQEVGSFSRGLKMLANELNIHIIALSQLSREVEKRADKRPMMSDIRESGNIEQDADNILLLYRENYYLDEEEKVTYDSGNSEAVEVIVSKQREGYTGMAKLKFWGAQQKFEELDEIAESQKNKVENTEEKEIIIDNTEFPF